LEIDRRTWTGNAVRYWYQNSGGRFIVRQTSRKVTDEQYLMLLTPTWKKWNQLAKVYPVYRRS
jgi:hypothetical protein